MDNKEILCTALFVIDINRILEIFSPKHEAVFGDHSTIEFKPNNLNDINVGEIYDIKILGRATDEKGDALLVENIKSKNKFPHITLSCIKNLDPLYSNELLQKAFDNGLIEYFEKPILIKVVEGYSDGLNEFRA
ncbi:MAG: hypothetical protein NTU81_03625 [Candidatus Nomurabacteria bacterium]|nr:hypothetical protein [Candidatus Nomurabacteria bacterium]